MNTQLLWDDLRVVAAIAAQGSLSGAGRQLGLSHATVFRRLAKIDDRLGVKLFERSRTGYVLTLAGEEVVAAARRIEVEILNVERRVVGRDLRPSGIVRVTTTDTLLAGLLSPILVAFRKAHPDISLEIAVSNELFSLAKREADIAFRPSATPPESLVGRKIGTIAQAIYGKTGVAETSTDWIGPDERMAYRLLDKWMAKQGLNARCRTRIDTVFGMYAAARDGAGLAVLPCYLGDNDKQLVRFGKPIQQLATDLWLLTHPDLRKTARIRVLLDFITEAMKHQRPRLAGN